MLSSIRGLFIPFCTLWQLLLRHSVPLSNKITLFLDSLSPKSDGLQLVFGSSAAVMFSTCVFPLCRHLTSFFARSQ